MKEGFNRRDFIRLSVYGALVMGELGFRKGEDIKNLASPIDQELSEKIAEQTKDEFGLTHFSLDGKFPKYLHKSIRSEALTEGYDYGNIASQLAVIHSSLSQYPPEFYDILKKVPWPWGFVAGLNLQNKIDARWQDIGGCVAGNPEKGLIVALNLNSGYNGVFDSWTRSSTHHELWHLASNPQVTTSITPNLHIDQTLIEIDKKYGLNAQEFKHYSQAADCGGDNVEGFARCYGEFDPNEDGATIAECLMTGNLDFWQKLTNDQALREKAGAIVGVYMAISNGKMDVSYFEKIRDREKIDWGWTPLKLV